MNNLKFCFLLVLNIPFLLFAQNVSDVKRRIGGSTNVMKKYPPHVVAIQHYNNFVLDWQHVCMGTLISQTWVISAKHCFRDITSNYVSVWHGSTYYNEAVKYNAKKIELSLTVDLALVEVERINVPLDFIPKITTTHCPHGVRAVYYSFGYTGKEFRSFSHDLLYSVTDSNEYLCGYGMSKICFKPVDGTKPMEGDSGSGLISGYGPGPLFSETHDIRLIAVLSGKFQRSEYGTKKLASLGLAERISDNIQWIKKLTNITYFFG